MLAVEAESSPTLSWLGCSAAIAGPGTYQELGRDSYHSILVIKRIGYYSIIVITYRELGLEAGML